MGEIVTDNLPARGPGRGADLVAVAQQTEQRFWPKVDVRGADECWLWTANRLPKGYGRFYVGKTSEGKRIDVYAHRFSYELNAGPIPDGLTIDHLCNNPSCVNPRHITPASQADNNMRGNSPPARNARKTHCNNGHEFTEENTYVWTDGSRKCRTCNRESKRRQAQLKKEAA